DDARRADAQLTLEEATLAEFRVLAPFNATVLETFVEEGENVDTDTAIMEVGRLNVLEATAFLPADALARLSVADEIDGEIDAPSGPVAARAEIAAIDPRIDPVSRTVRVTLTLPNPDGAFPSGAAFVFSAP
ncbi:MAG: HlyD family efflux transporter periplasmic adaptor subunit, partial [Pseudomonadota bacterium]